MSELKSLIEPQPHTASSVYYAINKAPEAAQQPLLGLYALHRKWRESANYADEHQAVTTLNWWHHALVAGVDQGHDHPALRAIYSTNWTPEDSDTLQTLLHGHMHWHHLNRVEHLDQLQPTIDATGGALAQLWMRLIGASVPEAYHRAGGRALWWIDQIRHSGHNLSNQRLWIPMDWLKQAQTPAHIVLSTQLSNAERAQQIQPLLAQLMAQARLELTEYHSEYQGLNAAQKKSVRSWHTLIALRADLLQLMEQDPAELLDGLVSIAPARKWWRAVRT